MVYLKIISAVIALSSMISNLFVCVLFFYHRAWLKRPYNIFLLNLAITDMITGILMFIIPEMIIKEPVRIPTNSRLGYVYCKVLRSRWLLFALGAVSMYTSLVLTVERWTAVCRPHKYRARFTSRWLVGYIAFIWIVGFTVSSVGTDLITYQQALSNFSTPRCIVTSTAKTTLNKVISTIAVGLKFFVPSVMILTLYAVAIVQLKRRIKFKLGNHRIQTTKNVTKMAAVASITLIACWSPNQIYFVALQYDQVKLFTVFHNITIVLVFLSSTLNPFIYGLWEKRIRNGVKALRRRYFDYERRTVRIRPELVLTTFTNPRSMEERNM